MLKLTLKRAGRGCIFGMAMCNVIAYLISSLSGEGKILAEGFVEQIGSEPLALLVQTLITGVYGAGCFAGMSLYDIEHWSMLRSAVVHYTLIMAMYIPMSLWLHWFSTWQEIAWMTLVMAVSYCITWFLMDHYYRSEVAKLNKTLQKQQ